MRPHGKVDRFYQCQSRNSDDGLVPVGGTRKEVEPQQLFIDLALLICESRQPELSERGRVQGPHCPQSLGQSGAGDGDQQSAAGAAAIKSIVDGQNRHICDDTSEKCIRARQIETELRQLWSRGIPACLTVSLLPDECSKQDGCISEAMVLEKWTIQQLERRSREDKFLPGQFLLQAVRSHLHFSQLSAWLIASRGKSPTNIIYRVCLPGESESETSLAMTPSTSSCEFGSSDSESSSSGSLLEKHQFPLCSAGKNLSLSVNVESMPRCERTPSRSCHCLRPSTSEGRTVTETEKSSTNLSTSISAPASILAPLSLNSRQSRRSQGMEDEIPDLIIDEKEEMVEESDSPNSPLETSRSNSYQSFCDERSRTPPSTNETSQRRGSSQQLAFIPLNLPPVVSSTSAQHTRRQMVSATNPLFDISAPPPPPSFLNSKYHLKNRVDALRSEASLLSARLRTLSSSSTTASGNTSKSGAGARTKYPYLSSTASSGSRPRFFLADDEDDDGDEDDEFEDQGGQYSRSQAYEQEKQRCDSKAPRRRLFPDEKNLLANDDGTFSEWIDQTVDGAGDLVAITGIESGVTTAEGVEEVEEENKTDASMMEAHSFEERQSRDKNESSHSKPSSSGHSRKTKRIPTVSAATAAVQFHPKTGLPLSSSPAPLKRNHSSFNYDPCITSVSTLKSALYCHDHESGGSSDSDSGWPLCKSAPASTNLLGSFEESALNGRIKPFGSVDGFTLELGASGAFCPTHVTLPVTTLFFNVSDDNAPSPYFGLSPLESVGRRGYHLPKKGSVQATLFNPQGTVVKMFVVRYDLCDMPPSCQTFVRQRTFFMPSSATLRDAMENRSWLRYLIHLRFASSSSGKLFLHTDVRMLFSRKSELEAYNFNCVDGGAGGNNQKMDTYELRSFTEMPKDPKFSPRKFSRSDRERNYK